MKAVLFILSIAFVAGFAARLIANAVCEYQTTGAVTLTPLAPFAAFILAFGVFLIKLSFNELKNNIL